MAQSKEKKAELKKSKRREVFLALALMSPYIISFVIFTFIPVIIGVAFSFMRYDPNFPANSEFVGFQNYVRLFKADNIIIKQFWSSFLTMFAFTAVAVPCLIIIPLALAYFVNLQPPGYKIFRALIYLPSVVSISIMGIVFGNMFKGDSTGLINAWFGTNIQWIGGKPWEGDTLRWVVMLIASIWWQSGTNFVIFSGALRNVPKSLYEACEMDGGSKWKRVIYVTLPNIKSSVTICLFNTLIGYLALYGQPYTLSDSTNSDIMVSPMMWIQNYLREDSGMASITGFLCATAIVFGIISMVFGAVQRKAMEDRKNRSKYGAACKAYLENRKLLSPSAAEENIVIEEAGNE